MSDHWWGWLMIVVLGYQLVAYVVAAVFYQALKYAQDRDQVVALHIARTGRGLARTSWAIGVGWPYTLVKAAQAVRQGDTYLARVFKLNTGRYR